jgi:hypothetical protein
MLELVLARYLQYTVYICSCLIREIDTVVVTTHVRCAWLDAYGLPNCHIGLGCDKIDWALKKQVGFCFAVVSGW